MFYSYLPCAMLIMVDLSESTNASVILIHTFLTKDQGRTPFPTYF